MAGDVEGPKSRIRPRRRRQLIRAPESTSIGIDNQTLQRSNDIRKIISDAHIESIHQEQLRKWSDILKQMDKYVAKNPGEGKEE